MLECESWAKNWKKYFDNSLLFHINQHCLETDCIDYFVRKRFVGYRKKEIYAHAFLKLESGKDFSDYKYAIIFHADLELEERIYAFVHEITHAHYLNVYNTTQFQEELIERESKKFLEENQEFCTERYMVAMKEWEFYD